MKPSIRRQVAENRPALDSTSQPTSPSAKAERATINAVRPPRTETAVLIGQAAAHVSSSSIDLLLKDREGAALLGMSVPTFWRRVADGTIPRPIKLGGLSRWPQSEIEAVIEQAKAAREQSAS